MRVVISVGGRFHAIPLAAQLQQRDMLERLITTKRWYARGVLPARKVTAIPEPEYIGQFIRFIPMLRTRGYYSYVKDNLFDALARRAIPPCDIFHAWGNYALISIPYARRYHARVVIERGSTHPRYQDDILREEFERYGVHTERAHPQIIEKGLREIELADRVIIPSDFVRRTFIERGVPSEKLTVIPYGADLGTFRPVGKTDDVFRVLFVGNIGIQKGVHYLLEAWKRAALGDRARLVLAGRIEPGMNRVLAGYDGLFDYVGHIRHDALYETYGTASVFVLPSLQEGSALVTYEAMACGLPSIVSENTGSVVRDGIDGFVIPIRSIDAIAEKLTYFSEHPEAAEAMGRSAQDRVREFTWERYAEGVVGVYRALLGGAGQ